MLARVHSEIGRLRPIIESSAWVALTTLAKAVCQLIVVKWIAIKFGPSMLGVAGQAMSLIAILQALAGGGIANGIIREFASENEDRQTTSDFLSASFSYGLIFSGLYFIFFLTCSKTVSDWAFGTEDYAWFTALLGITAFFIFLSTFSQSLFSAKNLVRSIFLANFLGLLFGAIVFVLLTQIYQETGSLLGILALAIIPAFFFLTQLFEKSWFSIGFFKPTWSPGHKKDLLAFTLIALIGSALAPIIFVLLRSKIERTMGWEYVGYWQAILKIYDFVFSFIGLFLASTFYPKIAAASNSRKALQQTLNFALPFAGLLAAGLALTALLGDTLLAAIYSNSYRFLHGDLNILLLGGFFRAMAWMSAFFLMARNHLKTFLIFEVASSAAMYFICLHGLDYGFRGLIWGQVVYSVFYFVMLAVGILVFSIRERRTDG